MVRRNATPSLMCLDTSTHYFPVLTSSIKKKIVDLLLTIFMMLLDSLPAGAVGTWLYLLLFLCNTLMPTRFDFWRLRHWKNRAAFLLMSMLASCLLSWTFCEMDGMTFVSSLRTTATQGKLLQTEKIFYLFVALHTGSAFPCIWDFVNKNLL